MFQNLVSIEKRSQGGFMSEMKSGWRPEEGKQESSPIHVKKIGHVVFSVSDIERTSRFWTEIMGFKFSDRNEKGMVFFRSGTDHPTIALLQANDKNELPKRAKSASTTSLSKWEAFRSCSKSAIFSVRMASRFSTKAAAAPAVIPASSSTTRTAIKSRSTPRWIKWAPTERAGRGTSGSARRRSKTPSPTQIGR